VKRRLAVTGALLVGLAIVGPAHAAPANEGLPANDRRVIGHSVDGTEIVARHYGALDAPTQLVVIGQLHGTEPGGQQVIRELATRQVPAGLGLWLIVTANPDGDRKGTRVNARGVDLNRNFPDSWQGARGRGLYWPGPQAASEPETRALIRFLSRVRPAAVLSYHQAFDLVDISHPRSAAAGRMLAKWMGERAAVVRCQGPCHGTLTQWVDRDLKAVAITVELDHQVSDAEAGKAATAVLRLGRWIGR
jgi:succinylglutamate desuccinylase